MNPTVAKLRAGCEAYWEHESRDAMYRVAIRLVDLWRGNAADIADALGVILLTWNQASYRYGHFDFAALERFLLGESSALEHFRQRSIHSFSRENDEEAILKLFDRMLDALVCTSNNKRSPVATAKALHVLAPHFFPIWDGKIADGLGFKWSRSDQAGNKYIEFMQNVKDAVIALERDYEAGHDVGGLPEASDLAGALSILARKNKTILKYVDEYYYAKYTGNWID